jgi:Flp pilus assembly protein TadB
MKANPTSQTPLQRVAQVLAVIFGQLLPFLVAQAASVLSCILHVQRLNNRILYTMRTSLPAAVKMMAGRSLPQALESSLGE